MSNMEKAARIIERTVLGKQTTATSTALAITQALANAGLLAPDLTEPRLFENGEKEWLHPDGWINIENGVVTIDYNEYVDEERPHNTSPEPDTIYSTNPTGLRRLAYDMLAAANHLEQEQAWTSWR